MSHGGKAIGQPFHGDHLLALRFRRVSRLERKPLGVGPANEPVNGFWPEGMGVVLGSGQFDDCGESFGEFGRGAQAVFVFTRARCWRRWPTLPESAGFCFLGAPEGRAGRFATWALRGWVRIIKPSGLTKEPRTTKEVSPMSTRGTSRKKKDRG